MKEKQTAAQKAEKEQKQKAEADEIEPVAADLTQLQKRVYSSLVRLIEDPYDMHVEVRQALGSELVVYLL